MLSIFKDHVMQIHWLNTGRQANNYIEFFIKWKGKELAFQFRYTQL